MLCRTTLFAISLVSLAAQVNAQSTSSQSAPATAPAPVGYNAGYYGYSSTLQEGVQHGYADVLRAEGEQAYNMARAADQFETARDKWLDNRQQAVQQYFSLREANKAFQKAQHGKPTTKTVAQKKDSRPTVTVSVVRYDGQIEWPVALEGSAVAGSRKQLERLFRLRAKGQEVRMGSKEYRRGCDAIEKIETELKASVRSLSAADFLAAKKMLDNLKRELTQPTSDNLLTQN